MNIKHLNKKLKKRFKNIEATLANGVMTLRGHVSCWEDAVAACYMAVDKKRRYHVVNDIAVDGLRLPPMHVPSVRDEALEGASPDVMIIGGGISGASIARELMRYKLSVLLVDKEPDLAMQASGRNDGEVHPGVDLGCGTLKQKYVLRGNAMMDEVCKELDVPFERHGQYVGFTDGWLLPVAWAFCVQRRLIGVKDTRLIGAKRLKRAEPGLNPGFRFAIYNPSAGSVCPYGLTIAYAENAVQNGARVMLNTAVTKMEVESGEIRTVHTNRGDIYPKLLINAAGTFSEDVARMAQDRFYSIHPRRGTNSILDKKTGGMVKGIASIKRLKKTPGHSKGGGIVHTVHDNLLVGPNAVETPYKENFATEASSIAQVFSKQEQTAPELSKRDIITYFTGVRACTFEEDFIIERGRNTKNLIHCAGIQSPGLTTAPAVAVDVARMAADILRESRPVEQNTEFSPKRCGIPVLRDMDDAARARLIAENPDYGVIVCRCEQISRGEIIDALNSPICVPTLDGIKKRVRPGMGRCQGGFCAPLVMRIIAAHLGIPISEVKKGYDGAVLTYGIKEELYHEQL